MMNMNKTNYIEAVAENAASVTAGAYQYDRGIKLRVDGTTALLLQPIRQQKQFSCTGSKFPDFLLLSCSQAHYDEFLVNVYPATALVYAFHSIHSILGIAAQLSFFLYFSFRPFVFPYWTIRGAARELFINFIFDLRYRKKGQPFLLSLQIVDKVVSASIAGAILF